MSGQVQHNHNVLTIDASDLLLLDQADKEALVGVLHRLAKAKGELPAEGIQMIEHADNQ